MASYNNDTHCCSSFFKCSGQALMAVAAVVGREAAGLFFGVMVYVPVVSFN